MIGKEPHRNAASSEAAGDADADMSAADDERTGRPVRMTGCQRSRPDEIHDRSRAAASGSGAFWWNDSSLLSARARDARLSPIAERVTRRAANPAPAMKRSKGPKLATAKEPTKCSPATLDSKPADRLGRPPCLETRLRKGKSDRAILSTSIR